MRAGVHCGAAWPAHTQLRGTACRLWTPLRAASASRVTQRAARLDQGCVARLAAAVAAGAEPPRRRGRASVTVDSEAVQAEPLARRARSAGGSVAGEAGQAEPPASKHRAPRVGVLNEKTADGRPKPDERTVADLVRRGWFKSEEAAVALLTRANTSSGSRYAFETAEPAADWLEATLGPEPVKVGLCPAARALTRDTLLLARDAATLQRKWDALTLPAEQGGVGITLSTEQACEAVLKRPQLLGFSVETYKAGWSMLLSTSGLGQTAEEARECILRDPQILLKDNDNVVQRVALLKSLGYTEARTMVLAEPRVLGYKEETVKEHAAWWKQTGLDHLKLVTIHPTLLGSPKPTELQARLDLLSRVAGMSNDDLNKAGPLFSYSLDSRLRARYFYALMKHQLGGRYSINTLMRVTDAAFLAMMQGGALGDRASKAEVARYLKLVASAGFVAWRERQEAHILRSRS